MADYSPYMDSRSPFNKKNHLDPAEKVKAEGRYFRRIARRNKTGDLTRSETETLVAIINLWLHHRNGPKGFIHPSRAKLAKTAKCSDATVKRALLKFRKMGLIRSVSGVKGGQAKTTRYVVSFDAIQLAFDPSGVRVEEGQLVPFPMAHNDPVNDPVSGQNLPGQNDPLSYDGEVVPFQIRGGLE